MTPRDVSPLRRLWRYAQPHRRTVWLATLCSVLKKLFDLAPPFLIGMAIDTVARKEESVLGSLGLDSREAQFAVLTVLTLVIWGFESLFQYIASILWRNLAQTIQHELRLAAYAQVQSLEMAYFEDESTGGLMAILNDDVNQLERFLDVGADELIQVGTAVLVISAVFFAAGPGGRVAGDAADPAGLVGVVLVPAEDRAALRSRARAGRHGQPPARQQPRRHGHHQELHQRGARGRSASPRRATATATSTRRRSVLSSAFTPLIRMAILMGFTATLIYGGWLAFEGRIQIWVFSLMAFLTQRLLWPLTRLGQTFDLYQRAMASTNRVLDLLDREPGIVSGGVRLPPATVGGHFVLEDVSFRYRADHRDVLADLDVEMAAGRTTAIVGPDRLRQDDTDQAAAALLRRDRGTADPRRPRPP